MSKFNKFQSSLEKIIMPVTNVLGNSKVVKVLTNAMMGSLPITLGVSVFAILVNLPIEAWQGFLHSTGVYQQVQDIISATMSLLGLYIAATIGYHYAKEEDENPITGAILSLGAFIALVPQNMIEVEPEVFASFLPTRYLGSEGIFVAIIIGLSISALYNKLMKKGIKIKLPESVPSMVSDSMSPTIVAIIVFTIIFAIRIGFSFTPWGNIFDFINTIISKPIYAVGSSAISVIIVFTFINICWFFGLHPSPILNVWFSVVTPLWIADMEAFLKGTPGNALPFMVFELVYLGVFLGGSGNTLGLAINMTLFSKSEHYKSLGKLGLIPNLFNINEPIIFGTPIILNPIYFIPMATSSLVGGIIAIVFAKLSIVTYNPTVDLPWITPAPITGLLLGGISLMLMIILCIISQMIVYYPFFKIGDKKALSEEKKLSEQA